VLCLAIAVKINCAPLRCEEMRGLQALRRFVLFFGADDDMRYPLLGSAVELKLQAATIKRNHE
jgi:hypothetical protein